MSDAIKMDFKNLDEITRRLRAVGGASESVFRNAAEAGGRVIRTAAISNAPGPSIGMEVMVESSSRATVSVGPLKNKWFYRFHETGTRAHKAKKSAFTKYLNRIGRSDLSATEPTPMMMWVGGKFFAKKVSGIAARPFMKPALERVGEISDAVGAVYLQAILEKAG